MNETNHTFGSPDPDVHYRNCLSAHVVILRGSELAVIPTTDGYALPGGALAEGESPEQAIWQHCLKALGYDVRVDDWIISADSWTTIEGAPCHLTQSYYLGELLDPLFEDADTRLHWLALDRAKTLLRPADHAAVQSHLNRETSAAALAFIDGKHEFYG